VDHFLREQELVDLVQVFAHRPFDAGLQTLHIGLADITVGLLDLLANKIPGLQSLGLVLTPATVSAISVRAIYLATFNILTSRPSILNFNTLL
jgi:hypothetical protein